jgi:hypothetical protein
LALIAKSDRIADADGSVADNGGLEAAPVFESLKYSGEPGNFLQMAAWLKEPESAHDDAAGGKFAIQQID